MSELSFKISDGYLSRIQQKNIFLSIVFPAIFGIVLIPLSYFNGIAVNMVFVYFGAGVILIEAVLLIFSMRLKRVLKDTVLVVEKDRFLKISGLKQAECRIKDDTCVTVYYSNNEEVVQINLANSDESLALSGFENMDIIVGALQTLISEESNIEREYVTKSHRFVSRSINNSMMFIIVTLALTLPFVVLTLICNMLRIFHAPFIYPMLIGLILAIKKPYSRQAGILSEKNELQAGMMLCFINVVGLLILALKYFVF